MASDLIDLLRAMHERMHAGIDDPCDDELCRAVKEVVWMRERQQKKCAKSRAWCKTDNLCGACQAMLEDAIEHPAGWAAQS